MATSRSLFYLNETKSSAHVPNRTAAGLQFSAALTFLAVALNGYHPYAEDGGVYITGIKRLLHPDLYPAWSGFVTAHLRFSLFARIVAGFVRDSNLSLMAALFLLYAFTIWSTLFAAWLIADRCYFCVEACRGAVTLLALWLTMPIAGTSLMLMDPYVSARSISTPCGMLALVGMIDIVQAVRQQRPLPGQSVMLSAVSLLIAGLVHPLMAAYALGCMLLLACFAFARPKARLIAMTALCGIELLFALCLCRLAPSETPAYARIAESRAYWFLDCWHWYELFGLAGPLIILARIGFVSREADATIAASLARVGTFAGSAGIIIALLCARLSSPNYLVAMLQPLRVFQTVYILMIVAIGAYVGKKFLKHSSLRWMGFIAVLGTITWLSQWNTFPNSAHVELPFANPTNPWEQGFLWIRNNTPENAVFAMDSHYITTPGEDAQNFRAIAERSAAPDFSKDGGVASVAPYLTTVWTNGEKAQVGLSYASDRERVAALQSVHANWIVLSSGSQTRFDCLYRNSVMKVCHVPSISQGTDEAAVMNPQAKLTPRGGTLISQIRFEITKLKSQL